MSKEFRCPDCKKMLLKDYTFKCPRCKRLVSSDGAIDLSTVAEKIKNIIFDDPECQKSEFVCNWIDIAFNRLIKGEPHEDKA